MALYPSQRARLPEYSPPPRSSETGEYRQHPHGTSQEGHQPTPLKGSLYHLPTASPSGCFYQKPGWGCGYHLQQCWGACPSCCVLEGGVEVRVGAVPKGHLTP